MSSLFTHAHVCAFTLMCAHIYTDHMLKNKTKQGITKLDMVTHTPNQNLGSGSKRIRSSRNLG